MRRPSGRRFAARVSKYPDCVRGAWSWLRDHPWEADLALAVLVFLASSRQVGGDPATRAYYVSAAQQSLDEAFREFANMCCGALNRELSEQIPHLAMSIPYTLSSQCLAFLGELRPSFLSSSAVTINDSVRLQVTLCMCCSAAVDFVGSAPAAETTAGELEMF